MVVDKFGRQYGVENHISRGPPGVGFKLTSNGDFSVENKKISNVGNPVHDFDAVNRQSTLIVEKDSVSMRKRRLVDLQDPVNESDAITMKFARNLITSTNKAYVDQEVKRKTRKMNKEIRYLDSNIDQLYNNVTVLANTSKATYPLILNVYEWLEKLAKHFNLPKPVSDFKDLGSLTTKLLFFDPRPAQEHLTSDE